MSGDGKGKRVGDGGWGGGGKRAVDRKRQAQRQTQISKSSTQVGMGRIWKESHAQLRDFHSLKDYMEPQSNRIRFFPFKETTLEDTRSQRPRNLLGIVAKL